MLILEIDAGNSRIKWRILDTESKSVKVLDRGFAPATQQDDLPQEFMDALLNFQPLKLDQIRVSNVRGNAFADALQTFCRQALGLDVGFARVVDKLNGINSSYAEPGAMGVDRWLAMQGAYARNPSASCIVDCGSAITVDLLDAKGRHEGGFIVPGLQLMQQSLQSGTASLPYESVASYRDEPGVNTLEAIQHGALNMALGLLERVRQRWAEDKTWYFCGGDAELLVPLIRWEYILEPDLVFDGLAVVCGN
ncbi:MAG: hypothetical protein CMP91_02985 [Gammaproteobacteria bacterium]|nr:hypothetical protein [Gammaproteobacteria bacterium]MAY02375.1 hypothetical protein [Gammaproteobacteria bacterium]|tara:strand:- start:2703 stop:3455 length:753 start_codon:yes stop_codon:yes gene_type:complete